MQNLEKKFKISKKVTVKQSDISKTGHFWHI